MQPSLKLKIYTWIYPTLSRWVSGWENQQTAKKFGHFVGFCFLSFHSQKKGWKQWKEYCDRLESEKIKK